ncbi:hypothetical protein BH11PLA2_BH11PLA2_06720 [soil metagenome]
MTAEEWLSARNPSQMLEYVGGKVSQRKLRLFALECCRQNIDVIDYPHFHKAILLAEKLIDGTLSESDRAASESEINLAADVSEEDFGDCGRFQFVSSDILRSRFDHETAASCAYELRAQWWRGEHSFVGLEEELTVEQSDFIKDIFGNPFRPVAFNPAWRDSNSVPIAQAMYASRDFTAAPVLADAIEDAGCTEAAILDHLRDPAAVHVRGCWAVDLVLGKS